MPPALLPRRPSAAPSQAASAGGGGDGGGGGKEEAAADEIGRLEREVEGLRRRAVELKKVGCLVVVGSETAAVTVGRVFSSPYARSARTIIACKARASGNGGGDAKAPVLVYCCTPLDLEQTWDACPHRRISMPTVSLVRVVRRSKRPRSRTDRAKPPPPLRFKLNVYPPQAGDRPAALEAMRAARSADHELAVLRTLETARKVRGDVTARRRR